MGGGGGDYNTIGESKNNIFVNPLLNTSPQNGVWCGVVVCGVVWWCVVWWWWWVCGVVVVVCGVVVVVCGVVWCGVVWCGGSGGGGGCGVGKYIFLHLPHQAPMRGGRIRFVKMSPFA